MAGFGGSRSWQRLSTGGRKRKLGFRFSIQPSSAARQRATIHRGSNTPGMIQVNVNTAPSNAVVVEFEATRGFGRTARRHGRHRLRSELNLRVNSIPPFRLRQFPFREQGFRDLIAQLVQFAQLSNEIGSGVRDGCDASLKRAHLRPPELTRKLQMEAQTYPGRKRASGDSRRH